jgi:hypothetical protein
MKGTGTLVTYTATASAAGQTDNDANDEPQNGSATLLLHAISF